jgi:hypothetical protein
LDEEFGRGVWTGSLDEAEPRPHVFLQALPILINRIEKAGKACKNRYDLGQAYPERGFICSCLLRLLADILLFFGAYMLNK